MSGNHSAAGCVYLAMTHTRKFLIAAIVAIPFVAAAPASATTHVDPCPGKHIQVWAEVGNNGAGQATDHFVCGTAGPAGPKGENGKDGKDGKDGLDGKNGADSQVPGPAGPAGNDGATGPAGPAGEAGLPGAEGAPGKDGLNGADGAPGTQGEQGPAGAAGTPGLAGPAGPAGADGLDGHVGQAGVNGKDGVTKHTYVTINADGTKTVVDGLPHTGADANTLWLALAGITAVAAGIGIYTATRK